MNIRCGSEIKWSNRVNSTKSPLLSFLSRRKAYRNQGLTASQICVERYICMGQRVECGGHENVPLRSPTIKSIIDQRPRLLLSKIHGCIYSEARHSAGCS